MADAPAGRGRMVGGGSAAATGRFAALLAVEDLLRVMEDGDDRIVAYLEHPNVTMMAPIHGRLAAIVCLSGDEFAHVAIVARELGLPCAVQAELTTPPEQLDGRTVRLEPSGELMVEDA